METSERLKVYKENNSIHYYIDNNSEHVFVKNATELKPENNGKRTMLLLPVDENTIIKVPATSLPIDLTEQVDKQELINAPYFRKCLSEKYLIIVDDDQAFKILATPEAKKEKEKLLKASGESLNDLFGRDEITVKDDTITKEQQLPDINLTVMECLNREDIEDSERFMVIKNMENTLNEKDWNYIYEHGDEDLKNLAASKLN